MHVIVYRNEGPDAGHVYLNRPLGDDELLEESTFAAVVADELGAHLDEVNNEYIPNCCGDIRVEFMHREPHVVNGRFMGAVTIWSGKSFYLTHE